VSHSKMYKLTRTCHVMIENFETKYLRKVFVRIWKRYDGFFFLRFISQFYRWRNFEMTVILETNYCWNLHEEELENNFDDKL